MTIERLPSFTHFVVGLVGAADAIEVFSWEEAVDIARRGGYTAIVGVTWDATQLLALDGRAAGEPIAYPLRRAPA